MHHFEELNSTAIARLGKKGGIAARSSAPKNAAQVTRRKAGKIPKPKSEPIAPASSAAQVVAQSATALRLSEWNLRSRLEKGLTELQGLHGLLLSSEADPDVLTDLRDFVEGV